MLPLSLIPDAGNWKSSCYEGGSDYHTLPLKTDPGEWKNHWDPGESTMGVSRAVFQGVWCGFVVVVASNGETNLVIKHLHLQWAQTSTGSMGTAGSPKPGPTPAMIRHR